MPDADPLDAYLAALALKDLPRAGWLRRGLADVESVAAHSWGVAWLVVALLPSELDAARALTYAVLHDLPETEVGDLTPHDGVSAEDKAAREQAAMASLTAAWAPHLLGTWEAYEAQQDPEARFVKQLDRLDMALQALAYAERTGADLQEFVDSAAARIDHPALRPLLTRIQERMAAVRA